MTTSICLTCGHEKYYHNLDGNGITHMGTPRKYRVACEVRRGSRKYCPCKKFEPKKELKE